mmetsp:Transcript_36194/g.34231  ORF Transcript_36194/g.34231 Transcript_36194/m.34231 type:complete len:922 (-) Transcript_36194:203-2968(-)|eukprot:CAMPEP_0119045896 /NCGR_PEP_ID=MMETSP1177-20130426/43179_1 /TAXON_ID=2985 /ORGANISM="Ochromonas sp, Strain CCMP1899" /LENGTH=921 /DNA_ID=CAMNT_0007018343 /DNA_START=304 /DNA_END=3069 /DNA_ORIENTATION=+
MQVCPIPVFDAADSTIKDDLNMMILQYLQEQELFSTANAIQLELGLRTAEIATKRSQIDHLRNLICRGSWDEAHQLLFKLVPKQDIRRFLYHLNRLEFLELIEMSQHQQALIFLQTHLKPFEDIASSQSKEKGDFKELCYLLSCKSFSDSDLYRPWKHYMRQHELATEEICDSLKKYFQINMVPEYDIDLKHGENINEKEEKVIDKGMKVFRNKSSDLPSNRLISLLQQAFAYQIGLSKPMAISLKSTKNKRIEDENSSKIEINDIDNNAIIESTITSVDLPCVHRLAEDFKPITIPSNLMAVLTTNPRYKKVTHNHQEHVKHGDIRCLSMIIKNDFLMGEKEKDGGGSDRIDKEGGLIVVAGTDRGSLLLWSLAASGIKSKKSKDRPRNGHKDSSFNVSESTEIVSPAAFIQFKKGENVRVRRNYNDDDDDNELYPPKVRDVGLSPSASSLAWSHTDSSITSTVLVAAALSNGIIALLCAGPGTSGEDIEGSYSTSNNRSRVGSRDRENDSKYNGNTIRNTVTGVSSLESEEKDSTMRSCPMVFGKRRSYLETHEGDVNSIAFHPDGRFLASGGFDRSVAVHDVVATNCVKHFQGHQSAVSHVTYNPYGNLIISSSRDGTVKFWDTLSGICIRTIVPTLLVSKNNTGNHSGINKTNQSTSTPSTFYSTTSSSSDNQGGTGNTDYNSGEILSTEMSADGHYLLVTPKLSAVRILDIRKNEVVTRISSSDNSYNDYKGYKNKNAIANSNGLSNDENSYEKNKNNRIRNDSGEMFSTLSKTPFYSKGSFSLAKRRDIFLQKACFCAEGSVVASGKGSAVNLWGTETGELKGSLSLSNQSPIAIDPQIISPTWKNNDESDDYDNNVDSVQNVKNVKNKNILNGSYIEYNDQLNSIVNSPIESTAYESRYGILAGASAAGISLWI